RESAAAPHPGRLIYAASRYEVLDSLAVDADGHVCVAVAIREGSPGGIAVIDPEEGGADFLPLSYFLPTNICFSADFTRAYVTLSGSGELIAFDWKRWG